MPSAPERCPARSGPTTRKRSIFEHHYTDQCRCGGLFADYRRSSPHLARVVCTSSSLNCSPSSSSAWLAMPPAWMSRSPVRASAVRDACSSELKRLPIEPRALESASNVRATALLRWALILAKAHSDWIQILRMDRQEEPGPLSLRQPFAFCEVVGVRFGMTFIILAASFSGSAEHDPSPSACHCR